MQSLLRRYLLNMTEVLSLTDATVVRDGKRILGPISWRVVEGERWVVIGPNGAGKSTLFLLASSIFHPTTGQVRILGEDLGKVDVFELRPRIGLTTPALSLEIPEDETVINSVMTAAYAITGRWQESYDLWDESRAIALLTTLGVRSLGERNFGTLSEGEKKRVLIARALMADPELLLLDEPASGLDLGGREDLLRRLELLAMDSAAPATIIVTHHIEEIPIGTTHVLLLSHGLPIAAGEIATTLTEENLSLAYGLKLSLTHESGRYFARAI